MGYPFAALSVSHHRIYEWSISANVDTAAELNVSVGGSVVDSLR
jgi:hypothetical protein